MNSVRDSRKKHFYNNIKPLKKQGKISNGVKVFLGIDVGSVSTKFVAVSEDDKVLHANYFRTDGTPIAAVKKGLEILRKDLPDSAQVCGIGTTGSARQLAGVITGADVIKNEITAHAKGTAFFVPGARTVIEIGGQDSKIIILEDGVAVDFSMNLICVKGNTKITTNPSYASRLIKEIQIGQKVLTHEGKFKPVEQVFERKYQGQMIKIEISNLKKLDVTYNHPILGLKREDIKCYQSYSRNNIAICKPSEERTCKKRCSKWRNFSWEPKFIPAEEFREGDFLATPLPLENKIDNLVSIDYLVVKTEPKVFRPFKKAEYIKYLCGLMVDKKNLSSELLNLEPSLQKEILKGFFRGDGQLRRRDKNTSGSDKKGNRYCATTVSETLANQLYWLLLRNKIKCTIRKSSSKTKGGKYTYFIEVFGGEINKLEDKQLVNSQKNPYKSFIYSKWLFESIRKIKKYNFNGMVYNLNVKNDHSYVANLLSTSNCAAGTGAFLDAQAYRLKIPIEKFGEIALRSENPTTIGSRCTIFAESDMIHKQQVGHSTEDIIAGLCQGLVRNYLSNVAKGKNIKAPIVFLGGVSENIGIKKAFEDALSEEIMVPKYNKVIGALGVALLVKEKPPQKTKFFGFDVSQKDIRCTSFRCNGCPNQCEVIEARIEGKVIACWGDRCGKWSL